MSAQSNTAEESQKKKLIVYCVFGVVLVVFLVFAYNSFFGGSSAPPSAAVPAVATQSTAKPRAGSAQVADQGTGQGVAPGIAATKVASTSSSLDPTLDERAMLRTESLVYSGSGRNIFSLVYTPPVEIPKNLPPARPVPAPVVPPVPTGPPPPPPINLKYFGTVVGSGGKRQAFLLHDDDVYLASEGDIVARRYKIVSIGATSAKVEDLSNQNEQTLPLQTN